MKVTIVGIVIAALGLVILALAPAARRGLLRKHNSQAGWLSAQNWVVGAFVFVFGILIAAHVFNH